MIGLGESGVKGGGLRCGVDVCCEILTRANPGPLLWVGRLLLLVSLFRLRLDVWPFSRGSKAIAGLLIAEPL